MGAVVYHDGPSMRDPASVSPSDLVSVRKASARTGIPTRRIYKWIALEKVWSIRVGDRIMLHEDDVSIWEARKAS